MVILNTWIPIDCISLKKNLIKQVKEILEDEIIDNKNSVRIIDNITKKFSSIFDKDFFWYYNMHENFCTHKFKKGIRENNFCCKKIKSNNPKKSFLCCQHDPGHIPIPRDKKRNENHNIEENIDSGYQTDNVLSNINFNIEPDKLKDNKNILLNKKKKNNKKICRYYKKGFCKYKEKCNFLHIKNTYYNNNKSTDTINKEKNYSNIFLQNKKIKSTKKMLIQRPEDNSIR